MFDGIIFDTTPNRPGGHKFVDAPEVAALYERGVVLRIDAAEAAELGPTRGPEVDLDQRQGHGWRWRLHGPDAGHVPGRPPLSLAD